MYRLPTEAEWEYAARAMTTGDYAGNLDEMGWYESNSGNTTHPVGQKKPNGFGLYDMHGNVWEWCADPWHENYQRSPTDTRGLEADNINAYRLLRGGSWYLSPIACRCANRTKGDPDSRRSNLVSFRVVCAAAWTL